MTRIRFSAFLGTLLLLASLPVSGEEFILRPSDTIQLKIAGVPANDAKAITAEYVIDGQGYINLPNLGRIKISGLTTSAAQTVIETGYGVTTSTRDRRSRWEQPIAGSMWVNTLEAFKSEVAAGASVGKLPYGRLVKE
jgi:hypothetical protein